MEISVQHEVGSVIRKRLSPRSPMYFEEKQKWRAKIN